MCASFSSDGSIVAFVDEIGPKYPRNLYVWDWKQGRQVFPPVSISRMPTKPTGVAFNPNGSQIIVTGEFDTDPKGETHDWGWILDIDAKTGELRRELKHHKYEALIHHRHRRVLFAPDGKTFATASVGKAAHVWVAATGQLRFTAMHEHGCVDIDFSPDSKLLVTASYDGKALLWDVMSGQRVGNPLEHTDWVYHARFSRDGKKVVTSSRDRTARVWDVETGKIVGSQMEHHDEVFCAAFSLDGNWVFTVTKDGALRVWDRKSQPVTPRLPLGDKPVDIDIALGGTSILVSCEKSLKLFDWEEWKRGAQQTIPDDLQTWAELVSQRRLAGGEGVVQLAPKELLTRWQKHRESRRPKP
jgi:WD40 repeat protein